MFDIGQDKVINVLPQKIMTHMLTALRDIITNVAQIQNSSFRQQGKGSQAKQSEIGFMRMVCMNDNARSQTARLVKYFLEAETIHRME
ncbi:hypothetical protein TNCV_4168421 [Trichonephila clavipes]|nr:hypothetical protein TNCV_4168421 [Trichonephila clavipes]